MPLPGPSSFAPSASTDGTSAAALQTIAPRRTEWGRGAWRWLCAGVLSLVAVGLVGLGLTGQSQPWSPRAASAAATGVDAAILLPHRAIYRLSLGRHGSQSDVVAADGTMFYRFARACDGWVVENRTVLRLTYASGVDTETIWTFTSWEAADGLRFRFFARYHQDGTVVERLSGHASLEGKDGAGTAHFSEPPGRVVNLPVGTLFPTHHVQVLLQAAQAGERILQRIVFDGASLDNPYLVNAVLRPLPDREQQALARSTGLKAVPSWALRMAFFPYESQGDLPEFEVGAHYRIDGVADRIVQQFDTFSLDVRLGEFERLAEPDC